MSFFQTLNPMRTPLAVAKKGDLFILRERILHSALLILAVAAIPVLISGLFELNRAPYYLAAYLSVVMLLNRKLPYNLRAYMLLTVIYLLGVMELVETGKVGELRTYLITLIAMTAVLYDWKNSAASIILSILTFIGAGIYAFSNPSITSPALEYLRSESDWVTSTFFFLMISTIISGSISMIIDGLARNMTRQNDLMKSLQFERDALEDRIEERTHAVAHRMIQLRTASEISHTISALRDPEDILRQVVELMKERFDLYYIGIFLLDGPRQNAVLRAGTGEAGRKMLSQGHQLRVGGASMIGWAVQNRKARIALDVGTEAVRFNNPNLPLTRSELALPIIAYDEVLGAMTVQSQRPNAFDENDIDTLEGIANSLAIALENDRLYNETRQSLEEIRTMNRDYYQRAWTETIESYGELTYAYDNPLIIDEGQPVVTIQVPLMLRDEVIGHISLEVDRPALSPEDTTFVDNITTQTAIALENARLLHETERRAIQEQKLNELASRFSRALSIDDILRAAAQELGQLPAVMDVSVMLNPQLGGTRPAPAPHSNGGNGKEHA